MTTLIQRIARGTWRRATRTFAPNPNRWLRHCRGIIHVGANDGYERDVYARYELSVLWIEALPRVFATLQRNLADYPNQRAVNALVTDREGATYMFNVSDNNGESSSIYDFAGHKKIWPNVSFTHQLELTSTTLPTLLRDAGCTPSKYDALCMDVQGAELLVLAGAVEILPHIRFIKTEAADFDAYAGACTLSEIAADLARRGFRPIRKTRIGHKPGVGSYFDVLYARL